MKDGSTAISVKEGHKIANDSGFRMSRPTVLRIFKDSGSCVRIGGRFFMPLDEYLEILQKGEYYAENQANNRTNREDDTAKGEAGA